MEAKNFDLAIIGGGPGGYVAAIRAAQLQMRVALVERDRLGGICLNWGCIPTKALLRNAEVYTLLRRGNEFGIVYDNLRLDFGQVIKRSRGVADRLSKGVEYLLKKNNVTTFSGSGRLTNGGTIDISDGQGAVIDRIKAKNTVLATGARSKSIPKVEIDGRCVITSKEALMLEQIPKSMVIIGAGAIGVEFAYIYNTFGSQVTLIEMMPNILPLEDKEITDVLAKALTREGIKILTGSRVEGVDTSSQGITVKVSTKDGAEEFEGDVVLMAVGVEANSNNLGLEELGVIKEKGFIKVDSRYQTNVEVIYAIGDVIGPPLLAHVASAEGIAAVEGIAGLGTTGVDYDNIPSCIYCQPQVASIGLTEEKAKGLGLEVKIGRFPFRANGKSLAIGESEGLVKLIFEAKYGEILGAHIVGSNATEMIAEIGLAKSLESTHHELLKTVHAHPTLSEAIMEAAGDAYGEAIHI